MKKFVIKYAINFGTRTKTVEATTAEEARNLFNSWKVHQHTMPEYIYSITEKKPSFRSRVESEYRELGLVKCRGEISGETYWE